MATDKFWLNCRRRRHRRIWNILFSLLLFLLLFSSTTKTRRITKERVMHTQLALYVACSDWNTFLDTENSQNSCYRISLYCPPLKLSAQAIVLQIHSAHSRTDAHTHGTPVLYWHAWVSILWVLAIGVGMYASDCVCMCRIGWFSVECNTRTHVACSFISFNSHHTIRSVRNVNHAYGWRCTGATIYVFFYLAFVFFFRQ